MPPTYFPLRWESTGDQWWYASPIDWAAANGHYDLVRELLRIDSNHLIKLTSLRRIRRLETVWDDEEQFHDSAKCRSRVSRKLLSECEMKRGKNSLIQAGYGGWLVYTAASAGDLGFVQELLQRNPLLVFGEGEYVVTDILYAAARSKNSEVFRLLFDLAVSPKFCSAKNGELEEKIGDLPSVYKWEMMNRAVHAASRGGNLKILKELLSDSSDVLAYRDIQGSTILHAAAGRGQVEVINYLIAMYDIINPTDHQGNTPLHVAAQRGRLAAVEALIAASPSAISLRNNNGETFLHKAISGFQTTAFRRLDRHIDLLKHVVCGKVQSMEEVINAKNNEGRTALHMATIGNVHSDLVQLLMAAKSIDLNARDVYSMTPLDYLKHRPQSPSSDVLIRQLISAGGIFGCRDYTTRRAIALRLKMQGNEISPGTSFRVSDMEILSYTGIENTTSEAAAEPCSERISTSSMETTIHDSTNDIHNSGSSKKQVSVNHAAKKLRSVFHWPQIKDKNCEGRKKSAEENLAESTKKCSNLEETPTPLRQRFSKPESPHSNKRTLSVRSNQSSPSAKKKHASGIMHGVMQVMPHISIPRRSRSSSFSKSPLSSPSSVEKPKQMESEKPRSTGSNRLSNEGAPNSTIKHGLHKRFRSQYFCFGASGLGGKRPVLSTC